MRRREFIAGLGGAAAWPMAARAQQPERVRRIGVLMSAAIETDQPAAVAAFVQGLQQLGWTEGRNVRIDIRWARGDPAEARRYAEELIALASDVIMPSGQVALEALLQATRTVPIVFNQIADPVGAGYVDTLARPGGNATGFIQFDYTLAGKWLELLKQIAPNVTRAAVLRDPAVAAGVGQFAVIQSVAPSVGMQVSAINLHDAGEIERAIARFAGSPHGGLIVTTSSFSAVHHDLIIALAARHKLPAVYYRRYFVTLGGLISYAAEISDYRHRRLLRANRKWPRSCHSAEKGEEIAPSHCSPEAQDRASYRLKVARWKGVGRWYCLYSVGRNIRFRSFDHLVGDGKQGRRDI